MWIDLDELRRYYRRRAFTAIVTIAVLVGVAAIVYYVYGVAAIESLGR